MRLVFMDSDIPSIYFPVGKPKDGGSCAFATKKCLEYCPSGQIVNDHEKAALLYFMEKPAEEVVFKIILDYSRCLDKKISTPILQWFVWGDCLPELTRKISLIISLIYKAGIVQYGSTRNKKLWESLPRECNIAFTMDDIDKAKELSVISGRRTCSPDINTGYAQFIYGGVITAKCSGWWCHLIGGEVRESDCSVCSENKEGCFTFKP